jgi:hypothetical protein
MNPISISTLSKFKKFKKFGQVGIQLEWTKLATSNQNTHREQVSCLEIPSLEGKQS